MEKKRTQRIPVAIALLIVIFACVVAFMGSRLILGLTHRNAYDYKSIDIPANQALEVVDDGFIYYDGSSIASVTTDARVKWSYLIGRNGDFRANANGVVAWDPVWSTFSVYALVVGLLFALIFRPQKV